MQQLEEKKQQEKKVSDKTQANRDRIALQRERLQLKKERALFALEIDKETQLKDITIQKELIELKKQEELYKLAQINTQRAAVELAQLKQSLNLQPVMSLEEYNSLVKTDILG